MDTTWTNTGAAIPLLAFLSHHGISHHLIKLIRRGDGHYLLDGRPTTETAMIPTGATAGVRFPPELPEDHVATSQAPIQVVWQDDHWLVVTKPAGLTSVPSGYQQTDTLVNRLKGYYLATAAENAQPRLVSRLDRFTSGLVLVAKHRVAQTLAMDMPMQKTYWAVVQGHLPASQGVIDQPIGRPEPKAAYRAVMPAGQPAQTRYWVEDRLPQADVVRLQLLTGRTHQIRVHLASLGHPLVGDPLYHGPLDWGIDRQALHAGELQFTDPIGNVDRHITVPLPADMTTLIHQLTTP